MEECKSGPYVESKMGRFQVSLWKRKRVVRAKDDYDAEQEVESVRVCVRHSRYNHYKRCWENQSIWCNADELRDLVQALDGIDDQIEASALVECSE